MVLMRHSLMERLGGFDASIPYLTDLDYWVRALRHGDAYRLSEPVGAFRVSAESWSYAIQNHQAENYRRFIRKIADSEIFRISSFDRAIGSTLAEVNQLTRHLFYRLKLPHLAGREKK